VFHLFLIGIDLYGDGSILKETAIDCHRVDLESLLPPAFPAGSV